MKIGILTIKVKYPSNSVKNRIIEVLTFAANYLASEGHLSDDDSEIEAGMWEYDIKVEEVPDRETPTE